MPKKYIEPRNTTGWAHLLTEYAWSQRPPLTIGQLAIRAGVRKQTLYNWINGDRDHPNGVVPHPGTIMLVTQRLGLDTATSALLVRKNPS